MDTKLNFLIIYKVLSKSRLQQDINKKESKNCTRKTYDNVIIIKTYHRIINTNR